MDQPSPGFPVGHDAGDHLTYGYRLDHALAEGQFPVRWVEATNPGHGQPLFNFHQVGGPYLVALLHRIVLLSYALKATRRLRRKRAVPSVLTASFLPRP